MAANRKVTGTAWSMPAGIGFGCIVSSLISLAGAALSGILLNREVIQQSGIGYCAMILIMLSAVCGSGIAVTKIKRRRVLVCVLSGASYYLLLLSMTLLCFGGHYRGTGVTALLILGGCTAVAMFGLRGEKTPRYRKKQYINR